MLDILKLNQNNIGRDIITGDVHGTFVLLEKGLKKINFNPDKDRLFITGDLIDRGKNSEQVLDFIYKKSVFSVIGNHDAPFAYYEDSNKFQQGLDCIPHDFWYSQLYPSELKVFCTDLRSTLYAAIQVKTDKGIIGITHAAVPENFITWKEMCHSLEHDRNFNTLHACMWERNFASIAQSIENKKEHNNYIIPDVLHVFHGHSINRINLCEPYRLGNRYFIDTMAYGCSYKDIDHSDMIQSASMRFYNLYNPNECFLTLK